MLYNQNLDRQWWKHPDKHKTVWELYTFLKQDNQERTETTKKHMRLYGNFDLAGYTPSTYTTKMSTDRVTLNGVKAVVDTAVAEVARHRVAPFFATSEGNASLQRKARHLERFVETAFYTSDVHQKAPQAFLDACVDGTGALKVFRKKKQLCVERVFTGELLVDKADAIYGQPRTLLQRKYINREVLKNLFPKKAKAISDVDQAIDYEDGSIGLDNTADQLEVVEAWHLPSGEDAEDGRHAIVVNGLTLVDEEWKKSYFPFVFIRWSPRLMGFWGAGLCEELAGLQLEVNRILQKVQQAFHLLGVPWVLVPDGSKIKKAYLNNQVGAIIPYSGGVAPTVRPNQTIHPEVFQHLERLWAKMFELAGIGPTALSASPPPGIRSGVGLRTLGSIQSQRFSIVMRSYEQMHLDLARMLVDLGKEIHEEEGGFNFVAQRDKYTITQVDWSEVDMEKDSYVLKVFPASALRHDPAGRMEDVQDLLLLGLVDNQEAKRLLDFPDLDRSMALDRAASDNIDRIIEGMLDDKVYETPEPFMDLQLALKKGQASYNKGMKDGVPEDRLKLLRQWLTQVHILQVKSQLQQMAPLAMPGQPPAVGSAGAPPTAVQPQDGGMPF